MLLNKIGDKIIEIKKIIPCTDSKDYWENHDWGEHYCLILKSEKKLKSFIKSFQKKYTKEELYKMRSEILTNIIDITKKENITPEDFIIKYPELHKKYLMVDEFILRCLGYEY